MDAESEPYRRSPLRGESLVREKEGEFGPASVYRGTVRRVRRVFPRR